jgi:peptidoglycan/LPS O-acetylase OafA/YrhL
MTGQEGAYRPGVDGIRALAVAAVLCFHLDRLPGGNLGVDAFFVVSGWLITWKLLDEGDRTGRIALPRFWTARVRRLMPASLAVLVVVAVVWPLAGIDVPSLRRDLLFAAGWASNWGTISGGGDYWARFGEPSPVTHFWSLAIEEQYYLVWPLVLALVVRTVRRRRLAIGLLSAALATASIVAMNLWFDAASPTATYMNTFTRAHSLLFGATAAAVTTVLADGRLRGGRVARRLAPLGAAAAIAIVAATSIAPDRADWLFRWGFPAFALAMVPVVVAAADGAGISVLASAPMRWVADRSYGLYLWHWPVFLLLTPERIGVADAGVPKALVDLCRVAVAVVLADVSFRWLETPVRRRRRLVAWHGTVAAGLALTTVAVLAVTLVPASPATSSGAVVTLPPPGPPPGPSSTVAVGPLPGASTATGATGASTATGANPATPANPAAPTTAVASQGPVPPVSTPTAAVTTSVTPAPTHLDRPLRVLVTGDSTALHLSEALIAHAATVPDELVVGSGAFPGCGLSADDDGRMHAFTDTDGERDLIDLSGCLTQWDSVADRVIVEAVDVVLVEIGPWDAVDVNLADGRTVSVGDPVGRALVEDAYRSFTEGVVAAGARIVWVTPADTHLGWGEVDDPLNDPVRWQALREIVDSLQDDFGITQIDLPGWLESTGLPGPEARPDGVHLAEGLDERFVIEAVAPALADVAGLVAASG